MCFLFFQAGDGIRDHCFTGVQTCALPISPGVFLKSEPTLTHKARSTTDAGSKPPVTLALKQRAIPIACNNLTRSEERRVGKSVDLGGRRIIKKKKHKKQQKKK